jgi:hypothetical protein
MSLVGVAGMRSVYRAGDGEPLRRRGGVRWGRPDRQPACRRAARVRRRAGRRSRTNPAPPARRRPRRLTLYHSWQADGNCCTTKVSVPSIFIDGRRGCPAGNLCADSPRCYTRHLLSIMQCVTDPLFWGF